MGGRPFVIADSTLYFINLVYDPPKREGDFVTIGVSRDAGTTWPWKTLSKNHLDDRPLGKGRPGWNRARDLE
jgi:hypothetical protein